MVWVRWRHLEQQVLTLQQRVTALERDKRNCQCQGDKPARSGSDSLGLGLGEWLGIASLVLAILTAVLVAVLPPAMRVLDDWLDPPRVYETYRATAADYVILYSFIALLSMSFLWALFMRRRRKRRERIVEGRAG